MWRIAVKGKLPTPQKKQVREITLLKTISMPKDFSPIFLLTIHMVTQHNKHSTFFIYKFF